MLESSIVKKTYKWQPFKNRPVGRSMSRWKDDVKRPEKAESGKMVRPGPRST
jgi:hypothetical protein